PALNPFTIGPAAEPALFPPGVVDSPFLLRSSSGQPLSGRGKQDIERSRKRAPVATGSLVHPEESVSIASNWTVVGKYFCPLDCLFRIDTDVAFRLSFTTTFHFYVIFSGRTPARKASQRRSEILESIEGRETELVRKLIIAAYAKQRAPEGNLKF
ncbi:hypothetical protein K0M31_012227, partial [Melipona bicolor]